MAVKAEVRTPMERREMFIDRSADAEPVFEQTEPSTGNLTRAVPPATPTPHAPTVTGTAADADAERTSARRSRRDLRPDVRLRPSRVGRRRHPRPPPAVAAPRCPGVGRPDAGAPRCRGRGTPRDAGGGPRRGAGRTRGVRGAVVATTAVASVFRRPDSEGGRGELPELRVSLGSSCLLP